MVNKRVQNAVLGCNLKNDRMIAVCFQGKPFNIMVIQAYAPTSNTEEAEVEWFYEELEDLLELPPPPPPPQSGCRTVVPLPPKSHMLSHCSHILPRLLTPATRDEFFITIQVLPLMDCHISDSWYAAF